MLYPPPAPPLLPFTSPRYNGYDAAEYARVVERYEALEALHKEMKAKERVEALYAQGAKEEAAAAAAAAGEDVDEAKIQDEEDAGEGVVCVWGGCWREKGMQGRRWLAGVRGLDEAGVDWGEGVLQMQWETATGAGRWGADQQTGPRGCWKGHSSSAPAGVLRGTV